MAHRILLVDDEPGLLRALTVRLTACGFACDTAGSGKETFEKLQAEPLPDLVVVDLLMPQVSGYEVCRRLSEDRRTARIPIVVLTAIPEGAVEQTKAWLGAARVVHKPFESQLLVSTVCEVLKVPVPGGCRNG
jgi:DNA-binding response OmpR family regulator